MSMKNSNGNIGNRTRDLPDCTSVIQPNTPSRAKKWKATINIIIIIIIIIINNKKRKTQK
jgi:hypothetical protein